MRRRRPQRLLATLLLALPPARWTFSTNPQWTHCRCMIPAGHRNIPALWMAPPPRRRLSVTAVSFNNDTALAAPARQRRRYFTWCRMIKRLQIFYNQTGHSHVTLEDDRELHRWTQSVRKNYGHQVKPIAEDGRASPRLSDEKMEQLNNVEFIWDTKEYSWNKRYNELCEFHATHGHCNVPQKPGTTQLSVWVRNQRREYRHLKRGQYSTLSPTRFEALENIGFWDSLKTHEGVFEKRIDELTAFSDQNGHSNVPQDYDENPSLGQWTMNQRTEYKRYLAGLSTALSPSRIAALEKLDFRWNIKSYRWFAMLERLKSYQNGTGHLLDIPEIDLRLWLAKQRYEYTRRLQNRTSSLTLARIEALEAIPEFSWTGRSTSSQRGPTADDWAQLFDGIRQKGITPGMRPKQHWFEGTNRFEEEIKDMWTEEDLLALWNQEDDEDDEDL